MNKLYAILFLTLLLCNNIYGQRWISGQVTDSSGEPLIGVSVQIRGTHLGTITDIDGNYRIEVDSLHTTLMFSFVGFERQEIRIGNDSIIDVRLEYERILLSEVVINAYGNLRRSNLTGSITRLEPIGTSLRIRNFRLGRRISTKETTGTAIGTRVEVVNVNTKLTMRNFRIQEDFISEKFTHISGPTRDEYREHREYLRQQRERERCQSFVVVRNRGAGCVLNRFISVNINYPEEAMCNWIEGRVTALFRIDLEGNVTDVRIIRGLDPLLDNEVLRVIKAIPQLRCGWGSHGVKIICERPLILPVSFRLNQVSAERLEYLRQNQQ